MKLPQLFRTKHKKDHHKSNLLVGTGGKTNYRVLPNLRFAYAMPLVLLFAGIGTYMVFFGSAAPATPTGTANLWVDGGSGLCTHSNSLSAYNPSTACSTPQAAASKSSGGDVIVIAGGYSGSMSISDVNRSAAPITMKVENGKTVTATGYAVFSGLNGVTLDGSAGTNGQGILSSSAFQVGQPNRTTNFKLKGWKTSNMVSGGTAFWFVDCDAVTIDGLELAGLTGGADGIGVANKGSRATECTNLTFDHIYLHDMSCITDSGDHQDGIQIRGGTTIKFQNSKIWNISCTRVNSSAPPTGAQGFFANPEGDLGGGDISLINSVIGQAPGTPSYTAVFNFSSNGQKMLNNTIYGSSATTCQPVTATCNNAITKNNIFQSACASLALLHARAAQASDWANNVTATNCTYGSQGDQAVSGGFDAMFTNPTAGDFSLMQGSFAIDRGTKSDYPATDILGNTRYTGLAPDAGAYEYGATSGASATKANLWVAQGGSANCTPSVDPVSFADAATHICDQPQTAYNKANGGNLVLIQQGTYSATFSGGTKSPNVILKSAEGATSVGNPDNPALRASVKMGPIFLDNNTGHFVLDGVEFESLDTPHDESSPRTWTDFTIKNSTLKVDSLMWFYSCDETNKNITLDNNYYPEVNSFDSPDGRISFFAPYGDPSQQTMCGVTIQNSKFYGGYRDGVYVAGPQGIKILNNVFLAMGPTTPGPHTDGVQCVGGCQLTLDHNYFGYSGKIQMQGFGCFDGCYKEKITNNVFDLGAGASFETLTLASDDDSFVDHNTLATGVTCVESVPCGQIQMGHKVDAGCTGTCTDPSKNTTITNNIAAGISVRTNNRTGDTAKLIDYNLVNGTIPNPAGDNVGAHNINGRANHVGPPQGMNTTSFTSFSMYALVAGSLGKGTGMGNKDIGADFTGTTPPSTCSTKPGNANTDNVVNIQDIATVLSNYGKTVPTGTTNCADVNNDKIINIQDIAYILGRYGT